MTKLIDATNSRYELGIEEMDNTHAEFIELVNVLGVADKGSFKRLFLRLAQHTEEHFQAEKSLMQQYQFPAIQEHLDEHNRVSGELSQIALRIRDGSMLIAQSYVRDRLPEWFELHASTMDSALAAHLKKQPAFNN